MNWGIVLGIVFGAIIIGLALVLKRGFFTLLWILMLLGLGAVVLYFVAKWIFAPGWDKQEEKQMGKKEDVEGLNASIFIITSAIPSLPSPST